MRIRILKYLTTPKKNEKKCHRCKNSIAIGEFFRTVVKPPNDSQGYCSQCCGFFASRYALICKWLIILIPAL